MDLQELVERRIAELQGQPVSVLEDEFAEEEPGDDGIMVDFEDPGMDIRDQRPVRKRRSTDRDQHKDKGANITHFCEVVDAALVEVAGRVMEIAERITEDHARLEKQLLELRLETLENAESVMDMALNVRKKARRLIADNTRESRPSSTADRRGFAVDSEKIDAKPTAGPVERLVDSSERASMHDVGVAALFRKTH